MAGVNIDFKNFFRLQIMMGQACETLKSVFRERWKCTTGAAWVDSPESGREILKTLKRKLLWYRDKEQNRSQRERLESGQIYKWDLPMMTQILQNFDFTNFETTIDLIKSEEKNFQKLVEFRNKLSHHSTLTIGNEEFSAWWKEVAKILVDFGCSEDKVEEIRAADNVASIGFASTKHIDPKSVEEANGLKSEGNRAFNARKFDRALQLYNDAVAHPNISDELLAKLHSNIAAVYIKIISSGNLGEKNAAIDRALENAKIATELLPGWWRAHFRRGCAYEAKEKWNKAHLAYEQAVALNPLNKGVRSARDYCRLVLESQKSKEYFHTQCILEENRCRYFSLALTRLPLSQKGASPDERSKNTNEHTKKLTNLPDPQRIQIVKSHRASISYMRDSKVTDMGIFSLPAEIEQPAPSNINDLKAITLRDIDPTQDKVYAGCVLHLASVEDAFVTLTTIGLVVEDANGDVQRCYVYNFTRNQDVQEKLGFGCKFSLINPYMRRPMDGEPAIQVDVPASFFLHPQTDIKRCRFCGKGNSFLECPFCKNALYCSKECLKHDCELLDHGLICLSATVKDGEPNTLRKGEAFLLGDDHCHNIS